MPIRTSVQIASCFSVGYNLHFICRLRLRTQITSANPYKISLCLMQFSAIMYTSVDNQEHNSSFCNKRFISLNLFRANLSIKSWVIQIRTEETTNLSLSECYFTFLNPQWGSNPYLMPKGKHTSIILCGLPNTCVFDWRKPWPSASHKPVYQQGLSHLPFLLHVIAVWWALSGAGSRQDYMQIGTERLGLSTHGL